MTLTENDLVREMKLSSPENPLAAWSLFLSQRQQFLNNHLARVPVTPNQQGAHEMRDEILLSVSAQEGLDTNGYQVSDDLDDVEFHWENDQVDLDAVVTPGIDNPFSTTAFDELIWEVQQNTQFCSTKRKTRRTLLLFQQHQSLRDQHYPLHC